MRDDASTENPLDTVLQVARRHGRDDLVERLTAAGARAGRRRAVVAVVGDYKQGKSSLINALVGAAVCPTDDYEATAVLIVLYGAERGRVTVVTSDADGRPGRADVSADELPRLALSGAEAPQRIERIEVAVADSALGPDIALVDTPGIGALTPARAAAALAFLPLADGVIFVKDAGAELGATALAFLEQAVDLCPIVCVALTKTDTTVGWRAVRDRDASHLAAARLSMRIFPVAPQLAHATVGDASVVAESGVDELRRYVVDELSERGKQWRWRREQQDVRTSANALADALEAELAALGGDPAAAVRQAEETLREARTAGGRWAGELGRDFQSIAGDLDHARGTGIRAARRRLEQLIAGTDPAETWPDLAAQIHREVAELVGELSATFEERTGQASLTAAGMLRVDPPALEATWDVGEAEALIRTIPDDPGMRQRRKVATAIDTLRGSYGGMLLLGMFANLVAIPAALPVSVGVGVAFGTRQYREVSGRARDQRRQVAVRVVHQTLDAADFELSARVRRLLRELSRELSAYYTTQSERAVAAAEAAYRAARQMEGAARKERDQRRELLEHDLASLRSLPVELR